MTFVKRTFGVGVIRSPHLRKNLSWRVAQTETASLYHQLRFDVEKMGFEITAAVIDGKPDIIEAFWDISIQMCHSHQIAIMTLL